MLRGDVSTLVVKPHPLLQLGVFETVLPDPLERLDAPELPALLKVDAPAPLQADDAVRQAVRAMLRAAGYKPSGRGKPASEYLRQAAERDTLSSINPVVDACNVASLHSGLPISVVDLDRTQPPLWVGVPDPGASYVFNQAGQEIRLEGLLCLHDEQGPCANAVKDSQRTKTHGQTTRTLSLVWGSQDLPDRTEQTVGWYRTLLESFGCTTHPWTCTDRG